MRHSGIILLAVLASVLAVTVLGNPAQSSKRRHDVGRAKNDGDARAIANGAAVKRQNAESPIRARSAGTASEVRGAAATAKKNSRRRRSRRHQSRRGAGPHGVRDRQNSGSNEGGGGNAGGIDEGSNNAGTPGQWPDNNGFPNNWPSWAEEGTPGEHGEGLEGSVDQGPSEASIDPGYLEGSQNEGGDTGNGSDNHDDQDIGEGGIDGDGWPDEDGRDGIFGDVIGSADRNQISSRRNNEVRRGAGKSRRRENSRNAGNARRSQRGQRSAAQNAKRRTLKNATQ